jgi:hypothetical protein
MALIEREVLGWSGVRKERNEDGPGGIPVSGYSFGRKQIGHVHHGGVANYLADFRLLREVRDELIRSGRAIPHPAFPDSRTTASYQIRSKEDVSGALELFRISYERLKESAANGGLLQ